MSLSEKKGFLLECGTSLSCFYAVIPRNNLFVNVSCCLLLSKLQLVVSNNMYEPKACMAQDQPKYMVPTYYP